VPAPARGAAEAGQPNAFNLWFNACITQVPSNKNGFQSDETEPVVPGAAAISVPVRAQ
jgi:hypothetical protein